MSQRVCNVLALTICVWAKKTPKALPPILTLKDDKQYSVFADVVPQKGVHDFVTRQILYDIDTTGLTDIIFKTDNEPAIVAARNDVKQNRSHKLCPIIRYVVNPEAMGL